MTTRRAAMVLWVKLLAAPLLLFAPLAVYARSSQLSLAPDMPPQMVTAVLCHFRT
jgi:hypothetical protein